MSGAIRRGLAAGAVGTTALNAVTYLDMAVRGRDASSAPAQTVEVLARATGTRVTSRGDERRNRLGALGELSGYTNGLAVGVLASVARSAGIRFPGPLGPLVTGAAAMAATDVPMTLLGVTDPRRWSGSDWLLDSASHLSYGVAAHATLDLLDRGDRRRRAAGPGLLLRSTALGVASGLRSTLGVAGPVLTGATRGVSRGAVLLAAAAEVTADKLPVTPDRTLPPSVALRTTSGAVGAAALARRDGRNGALPLVAGAAGSALGTYGGIAWRRWASERLGLVPAGLLEDGVGVALTALACRSRSRSGADGDAAERRGTRTGRTGRTGTRTGSGLPPRVERRGADGTVAQIDLRAISGGLTRTF
ncbi:hypothetical protein [Quadrisphaera sp. DSM 44207]|uniref:hypothetical protein n=1 Tax=Quadrisphaera sp. DSM 44207 TaxID=1881057 RepID=UPI00088AA735|nr:hypothetical protein [Quadrisphaera sp. DSM 44207]SDQ36965.1 Uncharacterized membrane protein [Quadrisphaera sp. DSM 44207]